MIEHEIILHVLFAGVIALHEGVCIPVEGSRFRALCTFILAREVAAPSSSKVPVRDAYALF